MPWIVAALFLVATAESRAQSAASGGGIGRVVECRGEGAIVRASDPSREEILVAGKVLNEGDTVRTRTAKVRLLMRDNGVLDLGPGTQMTLKAYRVAVGERRRAVTLKLLAGRLWARVAKTFTGENPSNPDPSFRVETTNAVAGVRGTEFVTDVSPEGETAVTVVEGSVSVDPQVGEAPTEVLGPMTRGTVGREGHVSTSQVTSGDVNNLRNSVRSEPGAGVVAPAGPEDSSGGSPAPGGSTAPSSGESKDSEEQPPAAPPPEPGSSEPPILDLDPGASQTRVRGHVEVRP